MAHTLALPRPRPARDKSLAMALRRRCTIREIASRPVPMQLLSNLLWAACGVNREKGPFGALGLTTASASNSQEIEVLVATKDGVHRAALTKALRLRRDQRVLFAQTIGYPLR